MNTRNYRECYYAAEVADEVGSRFINPAVCRYSVT